MRKTAAFLLLALTCEAFAADFSGRWTLDASRSTGIPPGLEQTLVIEQKQDALDVATNLVTDSTDRVVDDVYALDGIEHDFPPQQPGLTVTSAKRSAHRTSERSFESTDRIEGSNASGPVSLVIVRKWTLSDDAKTLTVDQAVTNAGFTTPSKRVLVAGAIPAAGSSIARSFPVDLTVSTTPIAFTSDGKTHVAYELNVTSFRTGDVELERLEVLADRATLATFEGAALEGILTRPGVVTRDVRRIGAGLRAVAFLWIDLPGAAPPELRHRATFTIPASGTGRERIVESAPFAVRAAPLVIGPPVRGGAWIARWISNGSFHRRALMPYDGHATISQRFAIDWSRFDNGVEWTGDGTKNTDYAAYGQEVIAVADAVVARVVTDLPENTPGSVNPALSLALETAAGNHISLRLADGTYATYAHLQGPSIKVREGQHVRRGEVLARVGNSGNSVGPHLHFQLATAAGLAGEGVPYAFDAFDVIGIENGPPNDAKLNGKLFPADPHAREMPAEGMLIRFAS